MSRMKVLIADDHHLIRLGLRTMLESDPNIQLVGEACTGPQAVELAKKLKPDVVILDVVMPECDGIEAIARIQKETDARVLVLSMHDSEAMVREALIAGANGYVLKTDMPGKLKAALKAVCAGRRYLSPELSQKLAGCRVQQDRRGKAAPGCLTSREVEVARLLAKGKSSKEIGEILEISVRTVETHRANIMRKLNVHSVTELVHYVFAHGLLEMQGGGSGGGWRPQISRDRTTNELSTFTTSSGGHLEKPWKQDH
jgi:DNA-binding NarL/FixJ family response regulator